MKITPEAVKERIAALESAGELSLKEQFYLEALRQLVASVGSYPVAWDGVKVEPLYRHAQLATASEPLAVTDDELNAALQLHRLKVDGHSQLSDAFRAGYRYARRNTPQPAPVVPDDVLNRLEHEANHITAWHHMDEHSCKVNRRDLLTLVNSCRSAMLQAGNSPVIPDSSASMLQRWLAFGRGMQNAGSQLPRNLIAETEEMLAAAPAVNAAVSVAKTETEGTEE